MSSVKVAVRVRPFNDREKKLNATLIIKMNGGTTSIQNPVRSFSCLITALGNLRVA
jgi:hypothetical protein